MKLAHLGHSCVLVEAAGRRLLIDPGNFSTDWHNLTGLDAVLVTHVHPDHADPVALPGLLAANPQAVVAVEAAVPDAMALPETTQRLMAGQQFSVGDVTVETVGGHHAVIHADYPPVGNIGFVIRAPGEPSFFHPGDALDVAPASIDFVAIPAYGPWAAVKETIEFVRAVGAPQGFLIHDGLLNQRGLDLIVRHVTALTPTQLVDQAGWAPKGC